MEEEPSVITDMKDTGITEEDNDLFNEFHNNNDENLGFINKIIKIEL